MLRIPLQRTRQIRCRFFSYFFLIFFLFMCKRNFFFLLAKGRSLTQEWWHFINFIYYDLFSSICAAGIYSCWESRLESATNKALLLSDVVKHLSRRERRCIGTRNVSLIFQYLMRFERFFGTEPFVAKAKGHLRITVKKDLFKHSGFTFVTFNT